jgi:gluconokinase
MTLTDDDVALDVALDPLVLALDIGSTATRGGIHDGSGRRVAGLQHKVPHAFTVAPDGTSVIDPDQVTAEVEQVLDTVTGDRRLGTRIAGVAMDTFAASMIAVDAAGRALTPCLTYADSRSADEVTTLRKELDEHAVQQRTGATARRRHGRGLVVAGGVRPGPADRAAAGRDVHGGVDRPARPPHRRVRPRTPRCRRRRPQ